MSDCQTASVSLIALVPLLCTLPAVAQPIEAAADSPQTIITTQDQHTQIDGGISVNGHLFHRFDAFNVEAGSTADFITLDSTQAVIGQVSGGNISYIDGTLQVSGSDADLYLINPAGIFFGPNAQLNLNGDFTATTADQIGFGDTWVDIANTQNYSQIETEPSAYKFTSQTPGSVVNHADLAVENGNAVRLIGGEVVNTGSISAPAGEITLTAVPGESLVRLDATGSLLNLELEALELEALPSTITPLALPELLTGGASTSATALQTNDDGTVSLVGSILLTGELDVSNETTGETGGEINVFGTSIEVYGADLYANGDAGGGLIRIGGDYQGQGTSPTATEVLFTGSAHADALTSGDGGQIILWSDGLTEFSGDLSANGAGEGNGGLIETSGLAQLTIGESSQVSTRAPNGELGTWLLDPTDLAIVSIGGSAGIVAGTNTAADSSLDVVTLTSALNATNVTLQATNSITVDAAVDATGNANPGNLHLQTNSLNLNEQIALQGASQLTGTADNVQLGTQGLLQNAVDAVATGGNIGLASTTYQNGETFISRDVTLQGQGIGSTIFSGGNTNRLFNVSGGTLTLDGVTIQNGFADKGAGILVQNSANLVLTNSRLANNSATAPGLGKGGALQLEGTGTTLLSATTLDSNSAQDNGGAIALTADHSLAIDSSTFSNNQTNSEGGAIAFDTASIVGGLSITDSTFSGNQARTRGAAVTVVDSGTASIQQSTITNSQAGNTGAGLAISPSSTVNLTSSIIANNIAPTDSDISGTIISGGYNIVQNRGNSLGYSPLDLANGTNPILGAIADNGGSTFTHALLSGSPAIDATVSVTGVDQRGAGANGLRDIGAYERLPISDFLFTAGDGQTATVATAYVSPLEVTVVDALGGSIDGAPVEFWVDTLPANSPNVVFTSPTSVVTDSEGRGTVSLSANTHAGAVSINARSSGLTQRAALVTNLADTASQLALTGHTSTVTAGDNNPFTLTAQDQFGNLASSYMGTVTFSSSDNQAQLPTNSTLTGGLGTFSSELRTAGVHTLTATDTLNSALTASQNNIVVNPAAADNLTILQGNNQIAVVNTAFADDLVVQVSDRFGNGIPGIAASFTFPDAVGNTTTLPTTTNTVGIFSIGFIASTIAEVATVEAAAAGLTIDATITKLADVASRLVLSAHPAAVIAGDINPFTVTAQDQFGNVADSYSGSIAFSSSDRQAQLPNNSTLQNGIGSFTSELRTVGNQSISLTDTANTDLTATQSNIAVSPAAATVLSVLNGNNQQAVVNTAFADDLILQVSDRFGNSVAGETITFTSQGTGANGSVGTPTGITNLNGQIQTSLQANTVSGAYTVRADTSIPAQTGTLAAVFSVENLADSAQDLFISDVPLAVTAGDSVGFTVTARDQFGNVASDYAGTVDFSTTDAQAQLPGPAQLIGGAGQFSGEARTAGTHSLSITDTVDPSLSATQDNIVVTPTAPSNLQIVSGNGQTTVVNTAFADDLVLRLQDRFGNAIENEQINLAAMGLDTALSTVTTNAAGEGIFGAIASTTAGNATLQASINTLSAQFNLQKLADVASQFVLSAHPTPITAGETVPFTLTAQDQFNNIADSYSGTVNFSSSDLQAQLPSATPLSNGVGSFTSELRTAGIQTLTATDSLNTSLTATQDNIAVRAAAADSLTILSGNNQGAAANTPFAQSLTVEVRDRFNNPLIGEAVTFSAPTSGAGVVLNSTPVFIDSIGQATTTLSANEQAGAYLVDAIIAGLSATFNLENIPQNPPSPDDGIFTPFIETEIASRFLNPFLNYEGEEERDGRDDLLDERAFAQLEQSLTEEYETYWQAALGEGASLEGVQQILQQAENKHKSRSAVIYAVFVPSSNTETQYSSLLSRRLLTNDINQEQDQLLLLLIPPEGRPIQQRVDVSRRQLQRQAQLFNIELSSFFDKGYQPLARQLYSWLLAPIEDDIQAAGIDSLMYVLDAGLNTVPIAAMMTEEHLRRRTLWALCTAKRRPTRDQLRRRPSRTNSTSRRIGNLRRTRGTASRSHRAWHCRSSGHIITNAAQRKLQYQQLAAGPHPIA